MVLASGAGLASQTWSHLVPELGASARAVTFDRPGLGRSAPGLPPRTPTRIARELEVVLGSLAPTGPLVLVGHSMGGLHVLRYAALFPDRVAGVVLLDAPPPGFEEDRLELLAPQERDTRMRQLREGAERAVPTVRLERAGARDAAEWDFSTFPRAVPLVVIVADSQDFGDLGRQDEHRALWLRSSRTWLALSDRAELVIAVGSGHLVHRDRPDMVLDAVRRLMAETRGS